jgi:site-specific DNA recombinase
MMADGVGDYADMKSRLTAALAERTTLDRLMEETGVVPAIALHPNLADAYRRNIEKLTEALNSPALGSGEARQALRNLIELITAEPPEEGRGLELTVHGRLAQILQIAENRPDVSQDGCMFGLVAGTGFEPVTFRL